MNSCCLRDAGLARYKKIKISDIKDSEILLKGKGRAERVVFLNDKATVHLKEYLENRKGDSEFLFISKKYPYQPIKSKAIEDLFSKHLSVDGLHVHPHKIRHTMATLSMNQGVPIEVLKEWLGTQQSLQLRDMEELEKCN